MYGNYGLFGNGYIPLFVVIGAGYTLYYSDNYLDQALPVLDQAITDFNFVHTTASIEDFVMLFNETQTIENISSYFEEPN
ncbi:MAG: hypothetical protein JXR48_10395, partial [Candidatus Delongbacteria bacterium]|nr:hypothetical protein [Candidatus Delongbacteria bacterium]MBN2835365.1 hypothetical protein [Candidatus Delongbacteria bacterium]